MQFPNYALLHLKRQSVPENENLLTFMKYWKLKTKGSKDEKDLSSIHLQEVTILAATWEDKNPLDTSAEN